VTRPPTYLRIESALPGAVWPAIPEPNRAAVLAVLQQLEQSQWLPPDRLRELQLEQLTALIRHAWRTVPYYRAAWREFYDPTAPLTTAQFFRLPVVTRSALQGNFGELCSTHPPVSHGMPEKASSSGSTGMPVRFLQTELTKLIWHALTLRDHLWHRRDLGGTLAIVRRETQRGGTDNWGPATAGLIRTGPTVTNTIREDAASLLDWLRSTDADYLLTYPSLVRDMAKVSIAQDVALPRLREVRTIAEALDPELRELSRRAWNAPVVDLYSASETGYLALQCPEHAHYHVQSEGVLLEVLNESGAACGPGEVGRVVVTTLHNFATPLVRYDVGDFAEVGEPCPCGRGLPVLKRIVGRVRNSLVTRDGKRYWPAFGMITLGKIAPIRQHQFVQKSFDLVEARFVLDTPLTPEQESRYLHHMQAQLPPGMRIAIAYVDRIERSASGKFEDLVSEVSAL